MRASGPRASRRGILGLGGGGFAPVLLVFGAIGVVFTVSDLRMLRNPPEPGAWLGQHVTRMGAGYIATVSAFSSVKLLFLPTVLRWLWPTLVRTPLLVSLQRRYGLRGRAA